MASTASASAFARALPRGFYVGISVLMTVFALIGFWPSYLGPLLARALESQPIIHLHAAIFASWLVLLITQVTFAATGRIDLHRRLGRFGVFWGGVLLVVGIVTAIVRFGDRIDAGRISEAQGFVIWPLLDMVIFAAVFGAAVVYRREPQRHKRLMIVAATNLLVAPVSRWLGVEPVPEGALFMGGSATGHLLFVAVWTAPILLAMLYDWRRERRAHPIYVGGVLVLAISSFRDHLVPTAAWDGFTQWLAAVT